MKRGSIAILIILFVAVAAAAVSLWYHYANQQFVREFWGEGAAKLIGRAPEVHAMRLGEPGRAISPDEEGESPAASDAEHADGGAATEQDAEQPKSIAFEFDETPWMVVAAKDATKAKGIGNLRRALVLDSTFDRTEPAAQPHWQYALDMTDGHDFAAVLFDFETRQIALAGGRRTAVMNAAAAAEFQKFFAAQFDGSAEQPAAPVAPVAPQPAESTPLPDAKEGA